MAYIEDDINDLRNQIIKLQSDSHDIQSNLSRFQLNARQSLSDLCNDLAKSSAVLSMRLNDLEVGLSQDAYSDDMIIEKYKAKTAEEALTIMKWLRETMRDRHDLIRERLNFTISFDTKADAAMFKLRWGGL